MFSIAKMHRYNQLNQYSLNDLGINTTYHTNKLSHIDPICHNLEKEPHQKIIPYLEITGHSQNPTHQRDHNEYIVISIFRRRH